MNFLKELPFLKTRSEYPVDNSTFYQSFFTHSNFDLAPLMLSRIATQLKTSRAMTYGFITTCE